MGPKTCIKCNKIKLICDFKLRKDTGKYRGSCLICDSEYFYSRSKRLYDKNKTYYKSYYIEHSDTIKERVRIWRENNPERLKINRDNEKKRNRGRYGKDEVFRKRRKASRKKWRSKNQSKVAEYRRRHNRKLATRISGNLRSRLRAAIKGNYKTGSAIQDLGCSVEYLKEYLEEKFVKNMTWASYGKYGWHIDHIKPLSSFDLTSRKQFLEACHYTNLQPLWAKDNLKKGSKII